MALLNTPSRLARSAAAQARRGRAAAVVPAILCLSAAAPAQAQPNALELAVKATYLYKLAPFVTWPATALAGPGTPLTICVQGVDPFGAVLDRAISGQAVAGHPVAVRRVARLEAGSGCQIAYVGGGAGQSQAQALQALEGAPVLTVTDDARGGPPGIVNLVLNGGKVRFAIDASQAEANGVAISSKLLALAVAVKR
jgi:hypothetical protein